MKLWDDFNRQRRRRKWKFNGRTRKNRTQGRRGQNETSNIQHRTPNIQSRERRHLAGKLLSSSMKLAGWKPARWRVLARRLEAGVPGKGIAPFSLSVFARGSISGLIPSDSEMRQNQPPKFS
jgi:hypothetical protein